MSTKIRVLSDLTINKIAAGEVIENPSSVVKELVENSIDAGATNICIEIAGGGRQLIRISDNGCGMVHDDALMCLERHATSKIKEVDDIHEIHTMGFRGEAIPSIASISKFTLLTCPRENNAKGTMIIVDGGKILSCTEAVRSPGTTMEVKSLFFNVPVRKKFQKSPSHDSNDILKMISLLALGHPRVQFELISDQKSILSTSNPVEETFESLLSERIRCVLGEDFLSFMLPLNIEKGDWKISGFIGTPSHHRQNRTGQYLFINQRGVVSHLISFAIREGYGPMLPSQRHPLFVIHLTMPGSLVDVNVHPQKREVRLRQESVLKDLMKQGVQAALQGSLKSLSQENSYSVDLSSLPWDDVAVPAATPAFFNHPSPAVSPSSPFPPSASYEFRPPVNRTVEAQQRFAWQEKTKKAAPRVMGTMHRYIIVDGITLDTNHQGVCLVDQAAARRRILYEQIMQKISQNHQNQHEIQPLLIPITIDLPNLEAVLMKTHLETLNRMGFSIQEFGSKTFIIEALPSFFYYQNLVESLSDILNGINQLEDSQQVERERDKQIALAASRVSSGGDKRLSLEEAQSLVNQLMECESSFQCPQGKPTIVHLDPDEIAKQFRK